MTRSTQFRKALLQASIMAAMIAAPLTTMAAAAEPVAAAPNTTLAWADVPTQSVTASGVTFAYRELGQQHGGAPVVLLNHLAAVLDNWDPRVVDGIATKHHVVVFDNRGVGASTGKTPESIEAMADDAIAFIKAKNFKQVDLLGFSMGGMVSQEIVLKDPQLVRRMILAGTGPAGGEGIAAVAGVANWDILRAAFTFQDPKQFLFFTRSPAGIAAGKAFLARLGERSRDRDKDIAVSSYVAQLGALKAWGDRTPADLSVIKQPVLVANGDQDRMVPTSNSRDLAQRLPNSHLVIYPDAGHGGIFQYHEQFVPTALEFLGR